MQVDLNKVKPHLMVHTKDKGSHDGISGKHVGTVDAIDGKYIKLTKDDSRDHQHHWIPVDWIDSVDEKAVHLNKSEKDFYANLISSKPAN